MLNIGNVIGLIKSFVGPVKNALDGLGLTVENGKLCITVEDDTEEEEE